jgi:hypothetical protein
MDKEVKAVLNACIEISKLEKDAGDTNVHTVFTCIPCALALLIHWLFQVPLINVLILLIAVFI